MSQTICFTNTTIADVIAGHWLNNTDVIVKDGTIETLVPQGTVVADQVVDLKGRFLLPAFIDAHVHIESSQLTPSHFSDLVVVHGTGCVIADPHEIANVLGTAGLDFMIDNAKNTALDIRFMLPSCVPSTPFETSGAALLAKDLQHYFDQPSVLGLGEVMNVPGVLHKDQDLMAKLALALAHHRPIDGHAPLLTGKDLKAYAAAGVTSDHECSTTEEMLERIACGMTVLLRQGSAAKNLQQLLPAVTKDNAAFCCFCCDDTHPDDIVRDGHMEKHLRMTVAAGFDPMTVIQMATINTARHYRLEQIGAIEAGRRADFAIVDNLKDFNVRDVFLKGIHVAHDGQLVQEATHPSLPDHITHTVNHAPITVDDFKMPVTSDTLRAIGLLPDELLTESLTVNVQTTEGRFECKDNPGLLKIAVIERHHASGSMALGIVKGYLKEGAYMQGAVATTVAHDSHNIVVIGDNDHDMLKAVEMLKVLQGGQCAVKEGAVVATLALPVAGLMSNKDAESVRREQHDFEKSVHEHFDIAEGVNAAMTLSFLALPVIPHLKITDRGLFDVDKFAFTTIEV